LRLRPCDRQTVLLLLATLLPPAAYRWLRHARDEYGKHPASVKPPAPPIAETGPVGTPQHGTPHEVPGEWEPGSTTVSVGPQD